MDTKLGGQYPQKEAHAAANIALQCLSREAKARPCMVDVVAALEQLRAPKDATVDPKAENRVPFSPVHIMPQLKRHSPLNTMP